MNEVMKPIIWSTFGLEDLDKLDIGARALVASNFLKNCHSIRTIWLFDKEDEPEMDPMLCKDLTSLIIHDSEFREPDETGPSWVQRLVMQNPALKLLRLDGNSYQCCHPHHVNMRQFYPEFKLTDLFRFIGQPKPTITALSLHVYRLSELEMVIILENCPRLYDLDLYGVVAMPRPVRQSTDPQIQYVLEPTPAVLTKQATFQHDGIKQLTLTDTILPQNFARHMPNIERLRFRKLYPKSKVTRERLLRLLSLFPRTRKLELTNVIFATPVEEKIAVREGDIHPLEDLPGGWPPLPRVATLILYQDPVSILGDFPGITHLEIREVKEPEPEFLLTWRAQFSALEKNIKAHGRQVKKFAMTYEDSCRDGVLPTLREINGKLLGAFSSRVDHPIFSSTSMRRSYLD